MEKLKEYKYIILIIGLVVLGFAFYWYEYKPTKIKERCYAEAEFDQVAKGGSIGDYQRMQRDRYYEDCLMRFGLK
jgi:hypothetical protein